MSLINNMTNTSLREEFRNYCTPDNFSAPPGYDEADIIVDWWLSKLSLTLDEIESKLEKEKRDETPMQYVRRPLGEKLRIEGLKGWNNAIGTAQEIIKSYKEANKN